MVQHWNGLSDLIHRGPWWKNKGIVILNLIIALPLLTSAINGFDSSVLNGLQLVPDFLNHFHNPSPTTLGLMTSAQNLGALVALPIAPLISDGFGRRRSLCIGSFIMVAGVALQATSGPVAQFIVSRATIGFGLNIALNAAPLLITELAYPTQRGQITAVYNSIWYFGSLISAWACYGANQQRTGTLWSWKIPSIVQAGPSVLQMVAVWFIPESPRWLISRGRMDEAKRVLAKYHSTSGSVHDPLVAFEVTQIQHALRMEKEITKSTSYLTLVSTPGNRRRMRIIIALAVFSQWSGNGLISYYIGSVLRNVGIGDPSTQGQINGSLQAFNLIVAVSSALLVERIGRRKLFIASNTGMLIVFSLLTLTTALFNENPARGLQIFTIVIIFLFYLSYDLSYTPLLISYAVEILPFNIRAKGFAVMNIVVCLTLALNQFTNPVAYKAIGWKYHIFYVAWLVFELIFVIRFVIETRGRTLEETAALFDGEQPTLELQQLGNEAATQTMNELQATSLRQRLDIRLNSDMVAKLDDKSKDLERTESNMSSTVLQ